ncbi:hypothetical protein EVAR_7558_1 [Eumeta japonica]|uniref:Uncharacterized protein n=1 Tax=Eumeta variegata TaxID=151549 RepID=A0A4C1VQT8_EUMVA|nr:hypothetical protein EVAR_7558_1 [Eumeta japonica]
MLKRIFILIRFTGTHACALNSDYWNQPDHKIFSKVLCFILADLAPLNGYVACTQKLSSSKNIFTKMWAYAPIENSLQEEIDNFYEDLTKAHDSTSTKYIISMADFNALIGIPKTYECSVAGEYGYGEGVFEEGDSFNTHKNII